MRPRSPGKNGKLRFSQQQRVLRTGQLLKAAQHLLAVGGCERVRIEDVAGACGVAKGTCYRHFETREALLSAAISAVDRKLAERIRNAANQAPVDTRLEAAVACALTSLIQTLQRGKRAKSGARCPPWPCCLRQVCCPLGGARESFAAMHTVGRSTSGLDHVDLRLALELVMMVPVVVCSRGHGPESEFVTPQLVKALALGVLRSLVSPVPDALERNRRQP